MLTVVGIEEKTGVSTLVHKSGSRIHIYTRVRNAYLRQMKILLYTNCASIVVPQMNAQTCGVFTSSTLESRPYGSYWV